MARLRKSPVDQAGAQLIVSDPDYTADILSEMTAVEVTDQFDAVALGNQADEVAAEQADLYTAAGTTAARAAVTSAAQCQVPARTSESHVDHAAGLVDAAAAYAADARRALSPFVQRAPSTKVFYWMVLAVLAGGDMAAASGAYIMLGEIPAVAIMLAAATGMAAVIGGKAGADAKHDRLARQRQQRPDSLADHVQPWEHLFRGTDAGKKTVRLMAAVSGAIIVALTGGIWALRSTLDGAMAGVAFGLAALAISLGSVVNSYVYADDIADIIDAADKAVVKTARLQSRFAAAGTIARWRGALALAGSYPNENNALGSGAGHRVQAARWSVLARTPGLAAASVGPSTDDLVNGSEGGEPGPGRRTRTVLPIHSVNGVDPHAALSDDLEVI